MAEAAAPTFPGGFGLGSLGGDCPAFLSGGSCCFLLGGCELGPIPGCHVAQAAVFSASGANQGHDQAFQYAYLWSYPLLQFLPLKLVKWVAKNLADELDLPDSCEDWSSEDLNHILTQCLVLNRRGDNLHT